MMILLRRHGATRPIECDTRFECGNDLLNLERARFLTAFFHRYTPSVRQNHRTARHAIFLNDTSKGCGLKPLLKVLDELLVLGSVQRHEVCPATELADKILRRKTTEFILGYEKDTTGQSSALRPAAAYSLKNGTFVSPLSVLITQASPLAANCLISPTICW